MKTIRIVGLAFAGVFAFCAFSASAAFALESQWLVGGSVIPAGTSVLVDTEGELEILDLKAPLVGDAGYLCSFILDGTVSPKGVDEITEMLTLAGVKMTELAGGVSLECTNLLNCPTPLVFPINFPWKSQIELVAGAFVDHVFGPAGKEPGWEVECMGTGLSDTCETLITFLLTNGVSDVISEHTLAESEAEAGNCTLGGAGSSNIVTQGENLILTVSGATLAVSEA